MLSTDLRALTARAVLSRLPHRGLLNVAGDDRVPWLQGLVTQDLKSLNPGDSSYGCVLSLKGRVLTDFQVYAAPTALLLTMPRDRVGPVIEHLSKRLVIEEVALQDESESTVTFTVQGPTSAQILGEPDTDYSSKVIANTPVRLALRGWTGQLGYDVLVPANRADAVFEALVQAGAESVELQSLETARISAGIPRYGMDFDETTIPLEACLGDAIHWNKGCYLGQEVIARMAHRGHTNRELRRLHVNSPEPPTPNTLLFAPGQEAKAIGRITSAAWNPVSERVFAMAYVRRKWFEPGTTLSLNTSENEAAEATILDETIRNLVPDEEP